MTKDQFLSALCDKLSHLPQKEVEERLQFYIEAIEDRMEEGFSEEDAVAAVGSVEEIAAQIAAEIPTPPAAAEKPAASKRRMKTWEIVLLILGSPVWFSLLIAAFAVVLSLYVTLWAVVISLWAVPVSLAACGFAGVIFGIGFSLTGKGAAAMAMLGAGLLCGGLAVFGFWGCAAAAKGAALLTRSAALWVKNRFAARRNGS